MKLLSNGKVILDSKEYANILDIIKSQKKLLVNNNFYMEKWTKEINALKKQLEIKETELNESHCGGCVK
ncbi:hypothetical protein Nekkels1_18 [Cellulophaga phage Nekkels_1]|uniref:Uncharacterized protein n=1 Tax=Cellulophaga phage Nekkels_1 TaxID=2745692 RepID=A0A8E4XXU1_9CAUD|nr:hypothetical protein M1M31_gp18 [Cellulophaga phage Nekkels_1]QQO97017.1 hypothetical protein Nekkels1_18 [Cellulophaga phage Nekkels_1]QQO97110.1 hypothetical protein Nekkels2_18 [Cellulophaga phage Nekkels_2]